MTEKGWMGIGFLGVVLVAPEIRVFGNFTFIIIGVILIGAWIIRLLANAIKAGSDGSRVHYKDNSYDWVSSRSPEHLGLGCSQSSSEQQNR